DTSALRALRRARRLVPRRPGAPSVRDRRVRAHEIAWFGGCAFRAAVREIDRPDERGPVESQLLDLLQREGHLRPAFVQERGQERRDRDGIRRSHAVIVPRSARRALLLPLRILDAERRLRDELEALV